MWNLFTLFCSAIFCVFWTFVPLEAVRGGDPSGPNAPANNRARTSMIISATAVVVQGASQVIRSTGRSFTGNFFDYYGFLDSIVCNWISQLWGFEPEKKMFVCKHKTQATHQVCGLIFSFCVLSHWICFKSLRNTREVAKEKLIPQVFLQGLKFPRAIIFQAGKHPRGEYLQQQFSCTWWGGGGDWVNIRQLGLMTLVTGSPVSLQPTAANSALVGLL